MDTAVLDHAIAALQQQKDVWANLPIRNKIDLLTRTKACLAEHAAAWVAAATNAKRIPADSPWVGEEWLVGPWGIATTLNAYITSLESLDKGEHPPIGNVRTRSDGQVVAKVFPATPYDPILLNGVSAEVWMQPEITRENLTAHMASFYKQKQPKGMVCLVLGAGNVTGIPPLDTLHRLILDGQVVLLKMNPVNDYLAPLIEAVFAPFVRLGFLRVVTGGNDVGSYLTDHTGIDEIHLTGSAATHDAIVYGVGAEGAARKAADQPRLDKPVSSELGGVGPIIVVPGEWTAADLRFQAEHVVTTKLQNGGFNCVAAQVLVLAEAWPQREAFLSEIRAVLRELPERYAYYPGAAKRQNAAMEQYEQAETFGGGVPTTLITDIDPNDADAYAFNTEFFCAVLAETSLPGDNAASFLRNAVAFSNERLQGTLGATMVIHPDTIKELGGELDAALAELRYGAIGVNLWNAAIFLMAQATWGAYPGHSRNDIQSGTGVVHNALMFDKPQKTVAYGPFFPFPRGVAHGSLGLLPKPPWFVTNKTSKRTAELVTQITLDNNPAHLPLILTSALRG